MSGDFPGYFAGASLKRASTGAKYSRLESDFPGYFAGASLKRRRLAIRDAPEVGTSPATSPGPH